jgi:hypothetical protein
MGYTEALGQFEHMVLTAVYLQDGGGFTATITDKVCELSSRRLYMGNRFRFTWPVVTARSGRL